MLEGNVDKKKAGGWFANHKTYHMILMSPPRLLLQTKLPSPDDEEIIPQTYQKDILLHRGLKARLTRRNVFVLQDALSGKTYEYRSDEASNWVNLINQVAQGVTMTVL